MIQDLAARTTSGSSLRDVSDFETAIAACGFGCFNVCLLVASLFTATSVLCTTSSLSFILPTIVECDLKLGLMDKGYLYAMSFAGMITSAVLWGYIADTVGRKIVLSYALILNAVIVLCSGLSQTFYQLLIFKFVDGFLMSGPFAVVMSYTSEFHDRKHRATVMMIVGTNFSLAALVLPVLAISILPHQISVEILSLKIHTWHIFLLTTAVIPFFGGIFYTSLPESPKFLMSQGRNNEALESLRTVYAVNHKKERHEYPITNLIDEDPEKTQQHLIRNSREYKANHNTLADKRHHAKEQFVGGLHQLRPMFSKPYFKYSLHIYTLYFCVIFSLNTVRLWLPTIFFNFTELEAKNITNHDICTVFEYNKANRLNCDWAHPNASVYTDNLIVALSTFVVSCLNIFAVKKFDTNLILKICLCIAMISGVSMYFSKSRLMALILASIYVSVMCLAPITVTYASVNIFPTQMRTMVIIMTMTFGRFGSLLGNLLFPLFISFGCIPPFLLIGGVITVGLVLSLFLPNTKNFALK